MLKHTTKLLYLSDHYILSREWRVIVDQVQTKYYGRPIWYDQSGVTEMLIMRDPHYALSQLKTLELYILSCEKALGLRPKLELFRLYSIHNNNSVFLGGIKCGIAISASSCFK